MLIASVTGLVSVLALHDMILRPVSLWLPRWPKRVILLGAAALRSVSRLGSLLGCCTCAANLGTLNGDPNLENYPCSLKIYKAWLDHEGYLHRHVWLRC